MSSTGRWSRNIFSTSAGDGTSFAPSSQVNEGDANRGLLSTNGRASSFANSRNFELALLPQRSKTFPPVGPAAASYGGGSEYISIGGMASIDANGQETSNALPSNGRASMANTSWTPSSSALVSQSTCPCKFPWTGTPPSNGAVCSGPEHFMVRQLSSAEKYHLDKPPSNPYLPNVRFCGVVKGNINRLKTWPRYFPSTEESGKELKDGFVTLWTTFILAESLLASVAIQPFVSNVGNLTGWQFEIYGLMWMLTLITDIGSLAVTALLLGYLHSNPAKLTYMWVCNIGAWIGVPGVLVLLSTLVSLIAIAYSSWVIYGRRLGIICTVIEVVLVAFFTAAADSLGKAAREAEALE